MDERVNVKPIIDALSLALDSYDVRSLDEEKVQYFSQIEVHLQNLKDPKCEMPLVELCAKIMFAALHLDTFIGESIKDKLQKVLAEKLPPEEWLKVRLIVVLEEYNERKEGQLNNEQISNAQSIVQTHPVEAITVVLTKYIYDIATKEEEYTLVNTLTDLIDAYLNPPEPSIFSRALGTVREAASQVREKGSQVIDEVSSVVSSAIENVPADKTPASSKGTIVLPKPLELGAVARRDAVVVKEAPAVKPNPLPPSDTSAPSWYFAPKMKNDKKDKKDKKDKTKVRKPRVKKEIISVTMETESVSKKVEPVVSSAPKEIKVENTEAFNQATLAKHRALIAEQERAAEIKKETEQREKAAELEKQKEYQRQEKEKQAQQRLGTVKKEKENISQERGKLLGEIQRIKSHYFGLVTQVIDKKRTENFWPWQRAQVKSLAQTYATAAEEDRAKIIDGIAQRGLYFFGVFRVILSRFFEPRREKFKHHFEMCRQALYVQSELEKVMRGSETNVTKEFVNLHVDNELGDGFENVLLTIKNKNNLIRGHEEKSGLLTEEIGKLEVAQQVEKPHSNHGAVPRSRSLSLASQGE